jgi:hypothetical protein
VHDLPRSGRPRTSLRNISPQLPKHWFKVLKKSIWKTSAEFIVPPTSVYRTVKVLKLRAYHSHILQMLTEDDFDRRVEFSEWILICCEAEPNFPRQIKLLSNLTAELISITVFTGTTTIHMKSYRRN